MKRVRFVTNCVIVLIFIALVAVAIPFSSSVSTSVNPDVIYGGDTTQNKVSFMINVYWGTEYIEDMLDVLDLYDVKTTFFVGGSWFAKNVDIAKEIYKRGHEIGNHGYNHKDHDKITEQQNYDEIYKTHLLIKANLGVEMDLFAPPSGAFNDTTINIAKSLNYKTIMWTHDTIDWRDKDTDLIVKRATKNLTNGDLILMHPTQNTLEALPLILAYSQNNGFESTTVSKTLGLDSEI